MLSPSCREAAEDPGLPRAPADCRILVPALRATAVPRALAVSLCWLEHGNQCCAALVNRNVQINLLVESLLVRTASVLSTFP